MSNQTQPCQPLTVTLHDSDDQAVAGAAVQLRVGAAVQDAGELDAAGQVELCAPAGAVRVACDLRNYLALFLQNYLALSPVNSLNRKPLLFSECASGGFSLPAILP